MNGRLDLLDLLLGLEADLHEAFDGLLLLDRGVQQIDPQDVVVPQFVEELGIGIADDLVVLFEVNGNHKHPVCIRRTLAAAGSVGRIVNSERCCARRRGDYPLQPGSTKGVTLTPEVQNF